MSKNLFGGSDESDNELELSTNKDYAKSYNSFRKKELLKKYKDRGLDVSENDSSSDDSESSEEDEVLNPKFDQEFFKTLASLKSKDPTIYDQNTRFFESINAENDDSTEETDADKSIAKQKKAKPVTLKDYERKIILEKGGKFEDDSDAGNEVDDDVERSESPTAVEEQRRLKAEFQKVINDGDDTEDEDFGGIFRKREKSQAEQIKEEEDFTKWLAGKEEDIEEDVKVKLEPLKHYWSNNKLPQSERFLRDYILNKGYADVKFAEIPTYDEIVGDNAPLSEDEEELEKQAEFEQKYNFRFEEPDSEFIQRFPRTIENSLRRTDDKRKEKRQEVKERKQQEKEQKMKEFEIIKDMKRKEIEDKIQKLKLVTGNEELGFKDEELEEDFDPEAHDRRMQEIFNDEYYQVDEGEEKPECPSDIEDLKIEDWDNYDPQHTGVDYDDNEPHCEDDDFIMDCDYDAASAKEQLQKELIENTRGRKGRKGRRNRFKEMIETEKPAFKPDDEKTYAEYIDEYYKLDCEDIIGDLPCRFKYVETTPNDFGLTIEEILLAKNKELNQWASLKKATQIRPDYVEKKEQRLYKMKAKNDDLKRKIFKSLYGDGSDEENENGESAVATPTNDEHPKTGAETNDNIKQNAAVENANKKKKKRKRKTQAANMTETTDTTETTTAGQQAKKQKLELANQEKSTMLPNGTAVVLNRKKKKPKNKNITGQNNSAVETQKVEQTEAAPKFTPTNSVQKKKSNPFGGNAKTEICKSQSNPFGVKANSKPRSVTALPSAHKNKFNGKATNNKFKTKFNKKSADGNDANISDERLKAYGINPRKFHKKQKFGNK